MSYSAFFRRIIISIAILAMLMLTLAPAISNALVDATKPSSMPICSSNGSVDNSSQNTQKTSDFPGKSHWHFAHCPYCFTHAGTFIMPSSATVYVPLVRASFHYPTAYYQSSTPLFTWFTSQPRAPPPLAWIRSLSLVLQHKFCAAYSTPIAH